MSREIFAHRAEAVRCSPGIQPLTLRKLSVARDSPSRKDVLATGPTNGRPLAGSLFISSFSLLAGSVVQNGPERSRAQARGAANAPVGAAWRTLDGEDRSEIICRGGKRKHERSRIGKRQQATGLCANHDSI